ncbi:MAG: hypothetical protein A2V98_04235 [Planctomycetes bacterium RBG_16_64_12]|nr:MAG: hypothetical protein A2V98_04235 [Planctomycetes bacterium RBG_16_64_12]
MIQPSGEFGGGQPGKGGRFVDGKFGKALEFHGLMNMPYSAQGNVNLSAGAAEFWVALNFDAEEVIKEPGVLSNQLFFTVWGPGRSQVCVYSCLKVICVGVRDRAGQLVAYGHFAEYWMKNDWHHVELRWGKQLELWCDGNRRVALDWQGLFGPIDVRPDEVRLSFGSHVGWSSVESEFALDEFRILGPGGEQVPDWPTMTVPRMKAPVIDGEIGEEEWAGAAQTTGFSGLNDRALVEDQTVVSAGWDDEAFYVAFECLDPQKRPVTATLTARDSGVYGEDAVDVFLKPRPGPSPYYQITTSAIGTLYDSCVMPAAPPQADPGFNPNVSVKTANAPGRWTAELKIPFSELDGGAAPKDGDRWRANFCRDADTAGRLSSWAHTAGNFHTWAAFGEILFRNSDRGIRLGPLGDWAQGRIETRVTMTGLAFDPLVTVRGKLVGSDAKTIVETENRLADYKALTVKAPPLVTGLYGLTIQAATAEGDLYYQRLPFRVNKPYDVMAEGYPYEGKLWVTSNIAGLVDAPQGLVARSRLIEGKEVIATCETGQFVQGRGAAAIDINDLPPGKYLVKSEAVAPDGKTLAGAEAEFEQFARPKWWRSRAGLDHCIPPPWEPVRVTEEEIHVLGRVYRCGDGSLPEQVVDWGQELLAAPITLKLTTDGQTADLARLRAVDAAAPNDVSLRHARTRLGPLEVSLTTTTEFDGLQRCDLTLTPMGTAEVSSLLMEIPVKSMHANFLLPSNGISATARVLDKTPWHSGFLPQVWVGSDDIGFAWFAESDQFWRPRDEEMLEVSPEGDRTVIRCKMIREPLRVEEPITITFGLMATPVKDAHAGDPFWFRFGDETGGQVPPESFHYPGAGNLDLAGGTLEFWLAPARSAGGAWREVVSLTGQGGGLSLAFNHASEQVMNLIVTSGDRKETLTAKGMQLEPNQFTHVAVTWGEKVELFVGGKRYGTLQASLPADMANEPEEFGLQFGSASEWRGYTRIAVDEVRVSGEVLYQGDAVEVPQAPFQPNGQTLLLDHLDDTFCPDGEDAETRAAVISGAASELGGIPSIGCRFVDGKFGPGLEIASGDVVQSEGAARQFGFNASLFWFWLEPNGSKYGWPAPLFREPEIPDLREKVKLSNDLGLRSSTYMGYPAVGAPSPLGAQFGPEWSRRPLSTQPAEPPPGHYFWDVCGRSGFADYMAAGTEWILDDLGLIGCYTDGLAQVYPCQNTHHGCGYVDENGTLRSTWPLFATREMLKRMYKQIHAGHPNGYLVNHVSFNTIIPSMSFTDVYYTGEHEQYEDLVKFRVRWQGKQWGIWPVLLGPDSHSYESLHMTYCLLHGVSVWPQGFLGRNDMSRKTSNLWRTYDRFGYREAQWIPYYLAERSLAKADNEKVKVSLYLQEGKRALAIVGNLAHEPVNAGVTMDLKAMGLAGDSATNALDGRPIRLEGNVLSARLRPVSFLLVWVE